MMNDRDQGMGWWQKCREYFSGRFGVAPVEQSFPALEQWFKSPFGEVLLDCERRELDTALRYLFGYHLLQLSVCPGMDMSARSRINHHFHISPLEDMGSACGSVADFEHLPLAAESIDVAVLHHVLDFSAAPQQVMREAERVLIPNGHVVLLGFNPLSVHGATKWLAQLCGHTPSRRHALRVGRVLDWLHLLNLRPLQVINGCFRLPLQHRSLQRHQSVLDRLGARYQLPGGAFYLIVARKEVSRLTPIRRPQKSFVLGNGLVMPEATRGGVAVKVEEILH